MKTKQFRDRGGFFAVFLMTLFMLGMLFYADVSAEQISVPIDVPPGRAGMTPELTLYYDSGRGNGCFGVGWAINIGYVERDTTYGPPGCNGEDMFRYSLNGEASVLVESGTSGTYYHQCGKSYTKFEYDQANDYWRGTTRDGTVYTFGRNHWTSYPDQGHLVRPNSAVQPGECTYRWLLEKIENTRGHVVLYRYWVDENQHYPWKIYYTKSPTAGETLNRIVFNANTAATRPDAFSDYMNGSGNPVTTNYLIESIDIFHDDSLVRTMSFTMILRPRRGRY